MLGFELCWRVIDPWFFFFTVIFVKQILCTSNYHIEYTLPASITLYPMQQKQLNKTIQCHSSAEESTAVTIEAGSNSPVCNMEVHWWTCLWALNCMPAEVLLNSWTGKCIWDKEKRSNFIIIQGLFCFLFPNDFYTFFTRGKETL